MSGVVASSFSADHSVTAEVALGGAIDALWRPPPTAVRLEATKLRLRCLKADMELLNSGVGLRVWSRAFASTVQRADAPPPPPPPQMEKKVLFEAEWLGKVGCRPPL